MFILAIISTCSGVVYSTWQAATVRALKVSTEKTESLRAVIEEQGMDPSTFEVKEPSPLRTYTLRGLWLLVALGLALACKFMVMELLR